MLSSLKLLPYYRSDEHDILSEFYVPCLSRSTLYRRAVGFFSSSALAVAAKGLHAFIQGGGRMELIASPLLSYEDMKAIEKGYRDRRECVERSLVNALNGDFDLIVRHRLGFLAWLVETGRLEIRIAVLREGNGFGLYHEKVGLFSDGKEFVVFSGSPNESATGLLQNFESIDVYCSWHPEDKARAIQKSFQLERLWTNHTPRLEVIPFPEAARRSLLKYRPATTPSIDPELEDTVLPSRATGLPVFPDSITLRDYQQEAVENWFKANGRGILKMATGSGKTITALSVVEKLYRMIDLKAVIIVVPYRHLVVQWHDETKKFGLQPIQCFESRQNWQSRLQSALYEVGRPGSSSFLTVITTNATFRSDAFQGLLPSFPEKTLLIADEVHNLGARALLEVLPRTIGLRLGLSATPERWFDDWGSQQLVNYFGPVLQPEFTLADALRVGALVPYYYYPVLISLTDDESEEYLEISRKISRLLPSADLETEPAGTLKNLLIKRARLIGSARNKLVALRKIMESRRHITHALFYCGDGSVEDEDSGYSLRDVERVCMLLGNELGIVVNTYTAETPMENRVELRNALASGSIQGLVAIRCLDEGVDIPQVRTAFILASSSNPRQFIQRRGRVLRPYPGKEQAYIYDFIVMPAESSIGYHDTERQLLSRELQRCVEFANLALNAGEVKGSLVDIQKRYGLLSIT